MIAQLDNERNTFSFPQKDETKEAFDLMQDVNPSLPAEYILKGIVYALIGQETNNVQYIKRDGSK